VAANARLQRRLEDAEFIIESKKTCGGTGQAIPDRKIDEGTNSAVKELAPHVGQSAACAL